MSVQTDTCQLRNERAWRSPYRCRGEGADTVITDIIMPELHGVDVIATLRQECGNVRIIAISGGGNFGPSGYQPGAITTDAHLAAARKAVLTKPFERSELLDLVRSLTSG